MSRDSSRSYIHLHAPRLADLFEDFTQTDLPVSKTNPSDPPTNLGFATPSQLPHEDIFVAPHLLPPNPEDEDDVVPDQHAAFGITRAMAAREGRERAWRDFESLTELVKGVGLGDGQIKRKGRGTTVSLR